MNKSFKHLLFVCIGLLPLLYLAFIWGTIPEQVPTHFNVKMQPDSYSSKTGFFFIQCFLAVVSVAVYFLLQNIHKLDPKRAHKGMSPVFDKIAMGMVVFMAALGFVTIHMSLGSTVAVGKLMPSLIGLLFAFLGNLMHNVKPNYFVGVRLPWTLNSDQNWRKTHQLTGKLWFAGGVLLAVLSLFLPVEPGTYVMMIILAVLVLIPIFYSYSLYRKEQGNITIDQ